MVYHCQKTIARSIRLSTEIQVRAISTVDIGAAMNNPLVVETPVVRCIERHLQDILAKKKNRLTWNPLSLDDKTNKRLLRIAIITIKWYCRLQETQTTAVEDILKKSLGGLTWYAVGRSSQTYFDLWDYVINMSSNMLCFWIHMQGHSYAMSVYMNSNNAGISNSILDDTCHTDTVSGCMKASS